MVGERGFEPPTPWSRVLYQAEPLPNVYAVFLQFRPHVWRNPMVGFAQFIRERQDLHNVTPATLGWYANSLKWK